MAWQLIYTSAEHGLEAGRSGFCTVARHAAIRERLAIELERLSVFDRHSIGQVSPVVRSHRVVNIGSDSYHILSCLQDAGSDYSGRTNHIAHHLVCEAGELATAASPALILRQFPWRKRWDEPARYFDDTERVDLASFRLDSSAGSNAWKDLTGNAAHARLLIKPESRSGCYIAHSPGDDDRLLLLFHESLGRLADRSGPTGFWQVTFTTLLQATDNPSDFAWRGCLPNADSVTFDLTRPGSLPPPPPIDIPKLQIPQKSSGVPVATHVSKPDRKSSWKKVRGSYDGLSEKEFQERLSAQIPAEILSKRKRRKTITILAGSFVLLAVVALVFWFVGKIRNKNTHSQKQISTEEITSSSTPPILSTLASQQIPAQVASVSVSATSSEMTTTSEQEQHAPSELDDKLPRVPIYVLPFNPKANVDVGLILSRHGAPLRGSYCEAPFTSFQLDRDAKEGQWSKVDNIYQFSDPKIRTATLIRIDGKQLSVNGTNHLAVSCDSGSLQARSKFWLLLLNQDKLAPNDPPFSPIKLSRKWIHQTGNGRVTVSNVLESCLHQTFLSESNTSASFNLSASNSQKHTGSSMVIELTTPIQIQRETNTIATLENKLRQLEADRVAYPKTSAAALTNVLQQDIASALSNWLTQAQWELQDKNVQQRNTSYSQFVPHAENADGVWSEYVSYLKEQIKPIDRRLGQAPEVTLERLIGEATAEPIKLRTAFGAFNDLMKKRNIAQRRPVNLMTLQSRWEVVFNMAAISKIVDLKKPWPKSNELASVEREKDDAEKRLNSLPTTLETLKSVCVDIQLGKNWYPLIEFEN